LSSQSRIGCHIRIAGADAQKLSTSTLNGTWVPCRTVRVRLKSVLFSSLTIIARIAVNKNTSETKFLCALDFETSEDSAISSNGNFALDVNLGIDEILVILVSSIVDVDEGSSNVSAGRVAVEDGNAVVEGGCWVLFNDVFLERGLEGSIPLFAILCLCLF